MPGKHIDDDKRQVWLGSQGLGLYSVARNLANLTWAEIVSPIRMPG